jgi:hypothetical protein
MILVLCCGRTTQIKFAKLSRAIIIYGWADQRSPFWGGRLGRCTGISAQDYRDHSPGFGRFFGAWEDKYITKLMEVGVMESKARSNVVTSLIRQQPTEPTNTPRNTKTQLLNAIYYSLNKPRHQLTKIYSESSKLF